MTKEKLTTTLLCLHGMACTGRVWDPLRAVWDGPIETPDLAGHGSAPRLGSYDIASHAEYIREQYRDLLSAPDQVALIGHSMGGAVAVQLAGMVTPQTVLAVGVKTSWPEEELAGMRGVADKGIRWFDDQAGAETWFLKVSGLFGLVEAGSDIAASGVVEEPGDSGGPSRWRLATDPEAYRAGGPVPLGEQLANVSCPIRLGRGADDAMVTADQVDPYDAAAITLPGGHSTHVSHPEAFAEAITTLLG